MGSGTFLNSACELDVIDALCSTQSLQLGPIKKTEGPTTEQRAGDRTEIARSTAYYYNFSTNRDMPPYFKEDMIVGAEPDCSPSSE